MKLDFYKLDKTILFIVLVLVLFGLAMVFSASSFKAHDKHNDADYFLRNHFYKVLIGLGMMLVAAKTSYQVWLRAAPFFLLIAVGCLIYLLASPNVDAIRGSKRWISWGFLSFQPSDFARAALILFISSISGRILFKKLSEGKGLALNLIVLVAVVVPIALQPDMGTAALTAFILLTLIFISGQKFRYLVLPFLGAAGALIAVMVSFGYQKRRILEYIASFQGEGMAYQTKQATLALGNGGVTGVGLGNGQQKYLFLPDSFTDFLYAIIGEEFGILGTATILVLFLALISRGFKVAWQAPQPAGKLLGIGLTLNIAAYALGNAAVVANLLPTTGIPMPFLSYGGSALITNLFGVGVLLNISGQAANHSRLRPVRNAYLNNRLPRARRNRKWFGSILRNGQPSWGYEGGVRLGPSFLGRVE